MRKEASNKIVILLALVVIFIIGFSNWLVLIKINSIGKNLKINQENVM